MAGRWAVLALMLWASTMAVLDCQSVVIETDVRLAEQTQQQHLQALFNKYGHNGSITLDGLYDLLKGVGLDRIRKVMVHHHGNEHNHSHSHVHTHAHVDKLHAHSHHVTSKMAGSDVSVEKSEPVPNPQDDSGHGKKSVLDTHHNLYVKINQEMTTPPATPAYVSKSRRANRSADYDATQPNATHTNASHQLEDTHTHEDDEHSHTGHECQNASTILQSHGMRRETGLSVTDFSYLCPALLRQIESQSCLLHRDKSDHHHHHNHHHHHHQHNGTTGKSHRNASFTVAWIGGFLSITLISLLALVGVVLIPLMNRACFNFLLSFLVALAVGTLSGDALLHLIPHSQAQHHHSHSEHHSHDEEVEEDSLRLVWTGLTALSGVYIMFLIEHFLT